jgi:hypothetical protein
MRKHGTQVRQPSPTLVTSPCMRSPKLLGGAGAVAAVITGLAASLAALSNKKARRRQQYNHSLQLPLTQHHINEYPNSTPDLINQTASLHATVLKTPSSTASTNDLDTLASQCTTLSQTTWTMQPPSGPNSPRKNRDPKDLLRHHLALKKIP